MRFAKKLTPEALWRFAKRQKRWLDQMLGKPASEVAAPRIIENIFCHR
jgi:hypothetical protein